MTPRLPTKIAFIEGASEMGGVEYSTLYLAENLDRADWKPVVICPCDGTLPDLCRKRGIEVVVARIPMFRNVSFRIGNRVMTNPFALILDFLLIFVSARTLTRNLKEIAPRIVCTKGLLAHFYGGLAARWAGIPCVWHVQDLTTLSRGFGLYPLALSWAARLLAHRVIVDGAVIADQFEGRIYPPEHVLTVYNGVDPDEFSPKVNGEAVRSELGYSKQDLLIGCVARFTAIKGQGILVKAARSVVDRYPNAKVLLVGAPLYSEEYYDHELRNLVGRLGLEEQVAFAGYRHDLANVLAALDVFVFPSISKDTSPLALISALSAGKPIVATAIPGIVELFQDGDMVRLVQPNNPQALADALCAILGDAELRLEMGRSARRRALSSFTAADYVFKCQHVFGATIGN